MNSVRLTKVLCPSFSELTIAFSDTLGNEGSGGGSGAETPSHGKETASLIGDTSLLLTASV